MQIGDGRVGGVAAGRWRRVRAESGVSHTSEDATVKRQTRRRLLAASRREGAELARRVFRDGASMLDARPRREAAPLVFVRDASGRADGFPPGGRPAPRPRSAGRGKTCQRGAGASSLVRTGGAPSNGRLRWPAGGRDGPARSFSRDCLPEEEDVDKAREGRRPGHGPRGATPE